MRQGRSLVLLALALGVVASTAHAQSYRRTLVPGRPLCLVWNTRAYAFRVDSAGSLRTPGDSEQVALQAAFASWQALSNTCSDFTFSRGPDIDQPRVGYVKDSADNENVLTFRESTCAQVVPESDPCWLEDTCGNTYRCWEHSPSIIGLTTTTFVFRTGYILDADIELNAAAPGGPGLLFTVVSSPPCQGEQSPSCVSMDLQNTLTHEIGHAVGLDHVDDWTATMAATAVEGETYKRILDSGTAAGFCSAYPRGLPPTQCGESPDLGRQVVAEAVGTGCHAAPGSLLPGVLAAAAVLGRRRAGHHLGSSKGRHHLG